MHKNIIEFLKKYKVHIAVIVMLCIALSVLSIKMLFSDNREENVISSISSCESNEMTEEEEEIEYVEIETPYCIMKYPLQWKDYLKYDEEKSESFLAGTFYCSINNYEIKLFTVHFGNDSVGKFIGSLIYEDKAVPVTIESHDSNELSALSSDDKVVVYSMQECVNDVINSIVLSDNFIYSSNVQSNELYYFNISTPYVNLKYPAHFSESLLYRESNENNVYSQIYYCLVNEQEIPLFSIAFGDAKEGEVLGYVSSEGKYIPVCVRSYEFTPDNTFPSEKIDWVYSLAECINDAITSIISSDRYIADLAKNIDSTIDKDSVIIENQYVTMKFPSKYSEYLKIEEKSGDGYFYQTFCSNINDAEIKLFTVYFNVPEKGFLLGYVTENTNKISVTIESYEIEFEGTWTDEDKNVVYSMSESINDIMESIRLCENYSAE